MPEPVLTGLRAGPIERASDVARAIACCLRPEEDPAPPPSWLLDGQHRSFRRVVAALRRYCGALLADPVGSGKTYVALAVAASLNPRGTTACLVPATLLAQWHTAAVRVGVRVSITSHEQLSRGRLPADTRGLVIIDECHHFRNARTRRYQYTAPWLVGRPVLLVSATPVVNRLADLSHQLRLGVRDDALAADGVVSLHRAIVHGDELPALSRIVVAETDPVGSRPTRSCTISLPCPAECRAVAEALERVARLTLSCHPSTAVLIRGILHRAAGSSPAALLGALRRYQTLLIHARDAQAAGRRLGRDDLRRFVGEVEEQLVLWSLVGDGQSSVDLDLGDLEVVGSIIAATAAAAASRDPKLERLKTLLADGRPTLIFVGRRETVRHVRNGLGGPPVAWCTGEHAGIGPSRVARETVLSWFRATPPVPDTGRWQAPLHLVATDVAAEGLDLQRASRIVHYDSPWAPMRLEQREGRAVRLGSVHRSVDVVRFLAPAALEEVVHLEACLERKSRLPARAGLGSHEARHWQWRGDLGRVVGTDSGAVGLACVPGTLPGILAGLTLHADVDGRRERIGAVVGWVGADGTWSEERDLVVAAMTAAARSRDRIAPDEARRQDALRRLASPIRSCLAVATGRRWTVAEGNAATRRLAARLRGLASQAARNRDGRGLACLGRALAFVAGGHTAGEALLVERLAESSARELAAALETLPAATARPEAIEVRLSGVVLFGE